MIRSVISFKEALADSQSFVDRGILAFVQAIEKSLGIEAVVPSDRLLAEGSAQAYAPLAHRLLKAGFMKQLSRMYSSLPDEPHMYAWKAQYAENDWSAGASSTSDAQALVAALAECLERYLWGQTDDYLRYPIHGTAESMRSRSIVPMERFAGFSDEQRKKNPRLRIAEESEFEWAQAESLANNSQVYVPVQTFSGKHKHGEKHEPLIRPMISTGLATHTTREQAILGGALEVIERDAFMIMWLNQLTLPRIDLSKLRKESKELEVFLARCKQYRLEVDVVQLLTDAPTYAVCAIVRDAGKKTLVTLGINASPSLHEAAAHAIAEALRARRNLRERWLKELNPKDVKPEKILHTERAVYWQDDARAQKLDFLTAGEMVQPENKVWENDTPQEHLTRLVEWARAKKYEFLAVNIGRSHKNPSDLHVYMVVIPELQPIHMLEKFPCIGGKRLKEIPEQFGYRALEQAYIADPHPFI